MLSRPRSALAHPRRVIADLYAAAGVGEVGLVTATGFFAAVMLDRV